jgi:two-component system response regulator YesN
MRLLRFLVRYIEAAVHSEVAQRERVRAEQEASEHRHRAAGLRADLARALPAINAQPSQRQAGSRREEIVRRMLAFVHANYAQPLTLQRCADELALNAAYVCTLFSRTVGLPFKTYLTRLRIERARELLSDPLRRVSEVAFAVGYADVDRFRAAFIAATGQPPTTWRNALRVEVAPPC